MLQCKLDHLNRFYTQIIPCFGAWQEGTTTMKRQVALGEQDFEKFRKENLFYIDKTNLISEWWDSMDSVTLITRPRRFGKTLNLSMLNCFFSNKYMGRSDLFEGLKIWERDDFRKLQGQYPVIFISFADVKDSNYDEAMHSIKLGIQNLYDQHSYLLDSTVLSDRDKQSYAKISEDMDAATAKDSIRRLSILLEKHFGKKTIILMDEYDTPMQEAYVNGYWDRISDFFRVLLNKAFKNNPSLERGMMTGITRVSKESIFSDLNNLIIITTTSSAYSDCFGFTEKEVFTAMDEQGLPDKEKGLVKEWYDGFSFGTLSDIYNPWSIISYMREGKVGTYWANTSANGLVSHLLKTGHNSIKKDFELLLSGESITTEIDEQIVYNQLDSSIGAIWGLLLASGYLKVVKHTAYPDSTKADDYTLGITNLETRRMFRSMIAGWFEGSGLMNDFVKSMFAGNVPGMNRYMNEIALVTFSSFDTGTKPSIKAPENFYHGFVLGLLVENSSDYLLKSNRESGFGRYDVVMEPKDKTKRAVIMEFKVLAEDEGEKTLEDTARNALQQIEDKKYETDLLNAGITKENILKYGFAFEGKKCLIKMQGKS